MILEMWELGYNLREMKDRQDLQKVAGSIPVWGSEIIFWA